MPQKEIAQEGAAFNCLLRAPGCVSAPEFCVSHHVSPHRGRRGCLKHSPGANSAQRLHLQELGVIGHVPVSFGFRPVAGRRNALFDLRARGPPTAVCVNRRAKGGSEAGSTCRLTARGALPKRCDLCFPRRSNLVWASGWVKCLGNDSRKFTLGEQGRTDRPDQVRRPPSGRLRSLIRVVTQQPHLIPGSTGTTTRLGLRP